MRGAYVSVITCLTRMLLWLALVPNLVQADLKPGEGRELVQGHCSACHAVSLVTSQRGDRAYWLDLIRWMQQTQNLWEIPAQDEKRILDYLSRHYAESEWGRRPNLSIPLIGEAIKLSRTQ